MIKENYGQDDLLLTGTYSTDCLQDCKVGRILKAINFKKCSDHLSSCHFPAIMSTVIVSERRYLPICLETLTDEFDLSRCSFKYDSPVYFPLCQWQKSTQVKPKYLLYRLSLVTLLLSAAVYWLAIASHLSWKHKLQRLIFATNIGVVLVYADAFLGLVSLPAIYTPFLRFA